MSLKDPLVHFLLVGAALFALLRWQSDGDSEDPQEIVITAEQVAELRQATAVLQGREPTRAELEDLIEPAIREEIFYREALALELDVDDDEVRRRLVEKMQYLTQDLADPEPASEEELRAFFEAAPERFLIPELVTFDQVFFSPSTRGDALTGDVEAALVALRDGAEAADVGDRTPLQERFEDAPRERVAVLFGEDMTNAVFTLPPGDWSGPYQSDFGAHLLRVISRSEARQPTFDEVREQAAEGFAADRRQTANDRAYAEMRARYDVVVDWPEPPVEANPQ
jgi:PPIC-type PPIASE domain